MTLFPDPTPTSTTARPGAAKDRARPCSRCASRFTSKLACGIPAAGHAGSATRIPFKPSGATLIGKRPAGHPQQPKKRLNFGAISLDTERTDEATHGKAPESSARGFSSMNQPTQTPLCGAPCLVRRHERTMRVMEASGCPQQVGNGSCRSGERVTAQGRLHSVGPATYSGCPAPRSTCHTGRRRQPNDWSRAREIQEQSPFPLCRGDPSRDSARSCHRRPTRCNGLWAKHDRGDWSGSLYKVLDYGKCPGYTAHQPAECYVWSAGQPFHNHRVLRKSMSASGVR